MFAQAALRDRIVAADPGLTRLFIALRATSSVALALASLELLAHRYHLPVSVPLLGAALCITWSITVSDPDPARQRTTTLLMWIPAQITVIAGTLTAPIRILSDFMFLTVLFTAVYTRRYGPRANALGMIAVLGFFFTLFLQADRATLPWLSVAVTVSAAATFICRFLIFYDRPEATLRNAAEAFRARERLIAATIETAARRGGWTQQLKRRLDHHLYRLNETALIMDDLLRAPEDQEQRAHVADAELETGTLAERALDDPQTPIRIPPLDLGPTHVEAADWTPRGQFRVGTQIRTPWLQPSARQALQITIGAAAAMAAGEFLSTQRWYWAVLTSFLVFNGVSSTGETIVKGWSRVLGTALGIAAGAGVAYLVRGHEAGAFAMLFIFLFAGTYEIRVSYAIFTFFLTALLSVLYVLLGLFTDSLLVVRLIETVIGAACGGVAAMILFPISARDVLGNVSVEALDRLADVIERSVRRAGGDLQADPLAATRQYDEAMQSVRGQIEPVLNTAMIFTGRQSLRRRLRVYALLGRYARGLAISAYAWKGGSHADLDAYAKEVITHLHMIESAINGGAHANFATVEPPPDGDDLRMFLYRIDRVLHRLAALIVLSGQA